MDENLFKNDLLVKWRKELKLSQESVARELKVTRATVNRAENGHSVSIELLYDLANFYRKPISDLLKNNKFAVSG